jgi:hypothetical protein
MIPYHYENWAYKNVTVPPPAAGTDINYAPERGVRQLLLGANFTLQTSATVATRTVILEIFRTPVTLELRTSPFTQAASLLVYHSCTFDGADLDRGAPLQIRSIRLPGLVFIDFLHHFYVTALNLQAADQFDAIYLSVLEAIMPAEV